MTLIASSQAPAVDAAHLDRRLSELFPGGTLEPLGADVSLTGLQVSSPFAVHRVSVPAFRQHGLLYNPERIEWRCFLLKKGVAIAAVTLNEGGQVMAVSVSPRLQVAIQAMRVAEALESVQQGDYELRFLERSSLNFSALWLHATSGEPILVPLLEHRGAVQVFQAYDAPTLGQVVAATEDDQACSTD